MSFSSRRRNYLLTPHRRDGLIEWMKSMLMHSFVLNALDSTGADTFSHFEMLIDEHRAMTMDLPDNPTTLNAGGKSGVGTARGVDTLRNSLPGMRLPSITSLHNSTAASSSSAASSAPPSRLKQLVPTVGTFHTRLPLRRAFEAYNIKYGLTTRRHVCISFNEIRHILNLAQIMALSGTTSEYHFYVTDKHLKDKEGEEQGGERPSMPPKSQSEEELLHQWESERDSPSALLAHGSMLPPPTNPPPLSLQDTTTDTNNPNETKENATTTPTNPTTPFRGPRMITFDGDQTLYSDGANFDSNPKLANYLYLLLKQGVHMAVVTAAGYEYQIAKYELRLSGLLTFFAQHGLTKEECERFYMFGGECNYLMRLGEDYHLHPVKEYGPGGWLTATKHIEDAPANWADVDANRILDVAEACFRKSSHEQKLRSRVIRKKRSVGLIPRQEEQIPREALDETVLRVQDELAAWWSGRGCSATVGSSSTTVDTTTVPPPQLPYCAFNGGRDAWVDVGNKRVGVQVLQSYLGIDKTQTLHIGDQFLNTGNDYAARDVCPCVWITSPEETTYILKSILRLAGVTVRKEDMKLMGSDSFGMEEEGGGNGNGDDGTGRNMDFDDVARRTSRVQLMDVYTGEMLNK